MRAWRRRQRSNAQDSFAPGNQPVVSFSAVEPLEKRALFSAGLVTDGLPVVTPTDAELQSYVIANETLTQYAYLNGKRKPTIGVGFNLKRAGAKDDIAALGADYKQLLKEAKTPEHELTLTTEQVQSLFTADLQTAINGARASVPTFEELSHRQQVAVVDIIYSVGAKQFRGMKKIVKAIDAGDWDTAAAEIEKSRYAKREVAPSRAADNIELITPDAGTPQPNPTPDPTPTPTQPPPPPTPTPVPTPPPTPTPTPTPLPANFPAIAPATGRTISIGSGSITTPDGKTLQVDAGSVEIDPPVVEKQWKVNKPAPGNWMNQPQGTRWPDWALNLVPQADTLVLGGLYHGVVPESVVVKRDSDGFVFTEGVDYVLNKEWGQILNKDSRLGEPKTGSITITYNAVKQRLDLLQVSADGTVSVKRGTSAQLMPKLPEPDAGSVALAGIYVYTIDGAKDTGWSVTEKNIFPIHPADPVETINPGHITKTIDKLKAGGNVNIAFFGDSITDGAEVGSWWSDRSKTFTELTINKLKAQFPNATISQTLASEGGKSAVDSGAIFQKKILDVDAAGTQVDLVVIAMGMNDLGKLNGKTDLTAFNNAMHDYIQKAHDAGMEVLLVTPIQSNIYYEPMQTDRTSRANIAQAIRDIAHAENVTCVDMWQEWQNQATRGIAPLSQLHNMFNHPGEPGHEMYASAIQKAFKTT